MGIPLSPLATCANDFALKGDHPRRFSRWPAFKNEPARSTPYLYSRSDTPGDVGWFPENSDDRTHPIGQKLPNGLGLRDMSGNVMEWCWDWWSKTYPTETSDPKGPASTQLYRIIRGGYMADQTVDTRFSNLPSVGMDATGFRCVRK